MKKVKHIKFEDVGKLESTRKKHGYENFSEFVRAAVMFFIGWLESKKQ